MMPTTGDCFSAIKKGVLSKQNDVSEVFFDCIDINQTLALQSILENNDVVQLINSLLVQPSKREFGLQLLYIWIKQCNTEKQEERILFWLTTIMRSCNAKEVPTASILYYGVLEILSRVCSQSQDLSKKFSGNNISKIFESLEYTGPHAKFSVLKLMITLLECYPGSSITHGNCIEKFLNQFIDCTNTDISILVGHTYFLLAEIKSGKSHGANMKKSWLSFQSELIDILDSMLDIFYLNIVDKNSTKRRFDVFPNISAGLSEEPSHKNGQLFIRFRNIATYLNVALRIPSNTSKLILTKRIVNLLQKGVGVNPYQFQETGVLDKLVVATMLPKIQMEMLAVLGSLMETLGNHLKLFASTIVDLLLDVLKWTSYKNGSSFQKPFGSIRIKAYKLISLWMNILQFGSLCENYSEPLLAEIFADIVPLKCGVTLKVLAGTRKYMSKKARKQLQQAENEQSNIIKSHSKEDSIRKSGCLPTLNGDLCEEALKCLNTFIKTSFCFLKPVVLKTTLRTLLKITSLLYEISIHQNNLYYNIRCRKNVFNCLYVLANIRHNLCPLPLELILEILYNAQFADPNIKIRIFCGKLIRCLEKVIHPSKPCLLYPTNMEDVRNSFVLMGQEKQILTNNIIEDTFTHSLANNNDTCMYFSDDSDKNDTEDHVEKVEQETFERVLPDKFERTAFMSVNISSKNRDSCMNSNEELSVSCPPMPKSLIIVPSTLHQIELIGKTETANPIEETVKSYQYTDNHNNFNKSAAKKLKLDDSHIIAEIESEFVDELA